MKKGEETKNHRERRKKGRERSKSRIEENNNTGSTVEME
jgi:hypothetical protein